MKVGRPFCAQASSSFADIANCSSMEYDDIWSGGGDVHSFGGVRTQVEAANEKVIQAHVNWGTKSIDEALQLLESSGTSHPIETYVSLCWKCRNEKNFVYAKRLHMHVQNVGLEYNDVLGYHLVLMFVECGSVNDAHRLFNHLGHRSERCWTALIQGYVECGKSQIALNLFQTMQQDSAHASKYAITAAFKGCTRLRDLEYGRGVHTKIAEERLEMDQIVSNTLVDMYCKNGSIADAQALFDKLRTRDLVSWNILIGGYADQGLDAHLQSCLEQMKLDGISPDPVTYLCILKSCDRREALHRILEVHAEIVKEGFESILYVGNNLVHMYVKLGSIAEAYQVLNQLPTQNVVAWTALIGGYVDHGHLEDASSCLELMKAYGVCPNEATYICILKAFANMGDGVARGRELHAEIVKTGVERQTFVGNILVDMYSKCGLLLDAQQVFNQLPTRDVVSWTALLSGYAEHGLCREALGCLQKMQEEGVTPNATTFLCTLKACQSIEDLDKGQELHAEVVKEEFEGDLFLGNTLVDMYGSCGLLNEAKEVFDQLPIQNVVSWNALISGYAEEGDAGMTLHFLKQMELEGVSPTATTFLCSLKACGSLNALFLGQEIHIWVIKKGYESDIFFKNSLIDIYAKCGMISEAQKTFHGLWERNVISWNSLMAGYVDSGLCVEALKCFERMDMESVAPNAPTFVTILKACKSLGFIDRGHDVHAKVIKAGFEKDPFVANTLIDMYAIHGILADAENVFDQQQIQTVVTWTALIVGYTEHGFGDKALDSYEQMQLKGVPPDHTVYVCAFKACGNIGAIDKGREIFSEITKVGILEEHMFYSSAMSIEVTTGKSFNQKHRMMGLDNVLILHNVLIDMYCRCGSLDDAQKVFDAVSTRDSVTWNALISGHALLGNPDSLLLLFDKMKSEGLQPDAATYSSVLTACNHDGFIYKGQIYIEEMRNEYGLQPTRQHYNCIVDLLARAGQLEVAIGIVEEMPFQPDLVTWITVLSCCRKWGDVELGRHTFECYASLVANHLAGFVLMSKIYLDAQMWEDAKGIEEMRMQRTGIG